MRDDIGDEDEIDTEEINELKDQLTEAGFDDNEVQNIITLVENSITLVENSGGIENANDFLKSIVDAAGIDWEAENSD